MSFSAALLQELCDDSTNNAGYRPRRPITYPKPSIEIAPTNVDVVGGKSHTIACSISSFFGITDLTWIKQTAAGKGIVIDVDVDGKFSGGTLSDPSLTINDIAKSDEGIYMCRAIDHFGTTLSEDSVITCKECIEKVEIIKKELVAVGYGGTTRINGSIISSLTGPVKVNWQKKQNNGWVNLGINCLKYSGSSCHVNNPHLVFNNIDKEDAGIYKLEVSSPIEARSSPGILLELYGDEAESLLREEQNFVRFYYLCQKIATQAVRLFFDREVPGHTLESFLKQHRSYLTSQNRCTKEQEAKMFPGGQVAVVSTDFDFTLLYKLIRNLLTAISPPTCGWGNPVSPGHANETDDIERIRNFRNNLCHNNKFEICYTEFSTDWTDLSQAIDRLSKGSLSTDVESMRMKKLDKCSKNEIEEDMRKEWKEIHKECMELRQDIHNINTRHIPPNIRKGHVELIKKWKIEDKLFYDETGGFTATLEMVQSKNYMTIIGGPGSGKTATARHIAVQLKKKGWEVVPVCKLEDIREYGDRDHKQVFVLDDVLGIFALEMNAYNNICTHKEMIFTAIGYSSKLLFTCRKSVYKEAFKLGLFVTENVVDLQSKDNQLTETEKMAICQHHCKSKGVNQNLYASLSFTQADHMFPFLCKIFSRDEKYQRLGESFFNKPFEYFNNELSKLQDTHTIQYAVLVLCLVNEGKLSVEHLPPEHMKKEVFNNCGVNLGTPDKKIKDAIYHMSETYFTNVETEYKFTHDFIFEIIAYHYGCQNKHQIIKYLSSSYIANKVTVYKQASNEDFCIHISEDMYLPLAERLYTDIQSMNLNDVFMNKSLQHGPFLDVFEKMLKAKPFGEFKSLILNKRENIPHFLHTTFSINLPQQMIDSIESDRLILLFDRKFHVESGTEYNVRVISWIINYGHTHLLQEIVNHVECKNRSISLVFGSDVMENTHMLLLGCYSNTLDMVELILKYVDPKCIDTDFTSCCTFLSIAIFSNRHVTPLMAACAIGNLHIVKTLLRKHADINKCSRRSESPLFTASHHGYMDVVKYLLSSGADINLGNDCGQLPLSVASQQGQCDVVKCLLSSGAKINVCDKYGQSPLFRASQQGNCDVVKCLLSSGADINLCNSWRQSPLLVASQRGYCGVVKCLLSSGADINLCNNIGQSPLFAASARGHCDLVICLLSSGADIDGRDNFGQSPLFVASYYGHCDVVKCLLSSAADIEFRNNLGQSPLCVASYHGHCDVVTCSLSSDAAINLRENFGQSPLLKATQRGHCDVVECLLRKGADINLRSKRGQSHLFVASMSGLGDVVRCLLRAGADINVRDDDGRSPLFVASQQGHCDVVKCLQSSWADINSRNNQGQSPLCVASYQGHCDVVKCLLRFGADMHFPDKSRQSPLFLASMVGHFEVVKCLLSCGSEINFCDALGESPLCVASCYGRCDVVKCLLSNGADINLRSKRGQSHLFVASMEGNCDVVKYLLSSGVDIDVRDEDGRSPLFIASCNGHCDIVKCLLSYGADINLRNNLGQTPMYVASVSKYYDIVRLLKKT